MAKTITFLLLLFSFSASSQIPNTITPTEKIYGLSKFWSEVNYNFVYIDKVDQHLWESKYKELLGTIGNTKNDYAYYQELQRFCALLNDGHTGIYLPDEMDSKLMVTDFGDYKLFLESIEGRAMIARVNFSKRNEIPPGSEIIEINGLSTKDYIAKSVMPYISASTQHVKDNSAIYKLFVGFEGDTYALQIRKPDGKIIPITLTHKKSVEAAVFPDWDKHNGIFDFKWATKDIAYIGLYTFTDAAVVKQFMEKLPEIAKAKGIILDVRNNGGGSSANAKNIVKYFIDGNLINNSRTYSRMHIPTDKAIGSFLTAQDTLTGKTQWGLSKQQTIDYFNAAKGSRFFAYDHQADTLQADRQKFIVPTVILTGNNTTSAAEDFLIFADGQKHIKRIGEKTNGSTGQPLQIMLPGGGTAWICTKKVTYADGREFIGIGIKPDIEIKRTVKDFINGKDVVLDKAISNISERLK